MIISVERVLDLHKTGSSDVKKAMETLAPELFDKPFPKKMISRTGTVIYFTRPSIGMIIVANKFNSIGDYSTSWEMVEFDDYDKPVTI